MAMVRLFLVRHGQSVWNDEKRVQGQQDVPLSEEGRKQATALGERLKGIQIHACFSSPLKRAVETAELILKVSGNSVSITPLTELMERNFGDWEGKQIDQLQSLFPNELSQWLAAQQIPAPPNGESIDELMKRVEHGLSQILKVKEGNVLVVGHSGSVKAAICVLFRLPPSSFVRLRIDNAGLTVLEIGDGRTRLIQFNDTCHLHGKLKHEAPLSLEPQ
ncbi:MAG: histidine phosphatase family protein [Armatimonadetes bacterium]|nr:histidine phosphatase family protein [Armatimonadota bacterium]